MESKQLERAMEDESYYTLQSSLMEYRSSQSRKIKESIFQWDFAAETCKENIGGLAFRKTHGATNLLMEMQLITGFHFEGF